VVMVGLYYVGDAPFQSCDTGDRHVAQAVTLRKSSNTTVSRWTGLVRIYENEAVADSASYG